MEKSNWVNMQSHLIYMFSVFNIIQILLNDRIGDNLFTTIKKCGLVNNQLISFGISTFVVETHKMKVIGSEHIKSHTS